MKNLTLVLVLIFSLGVSQITQAQFFEKLKKKTEQKIKSEGEKRVEKKIDEGVNKGYDGIEEGIKNAGEESNDSEQDSTTETTKTNETKVKNNSGNETSSGQNENEVPFSSSTKYDFIPGDKVILYDDSARMLLVIFLLYGQQTPLVK